MIVTIEPDSSVPAYEQLRRQVAAMVATGTLTPGDRLPAIRRLAGDLDLAPGTVARAYRELETAGLVRTAGRRGTRVAPADDWADDITDTATALRASADEFVTAARQLGVDDDEAIAAVRAALHAATVPAQP